MTGGGIVKGTAKTLLAVGLLLLAFVAYQLWGTALYEHSAQARLRQELRGSLHTTGTLPDASRQVATAATDPVVLSRVAPTSSDPPVGNPVGLLSIPAVGVSNTAIVEGTGEGQLQQGPGHYQGTPLPGEVGNAAIAGHRTTYGAPFYSLDAVKAGDAIDVETPQGLFQYLVVQTKVVSPDDVSVLQPTALPELTLTTCTPRYSATQRLVVQALLHASVTNGSFTPPASGPTRVTAPASRPSSLGGGTGELASGSDVGGGVAGAVLWGSGALAAALAARLAWKRLRGPAHWLAVPALLLAGVFLLGCFEHVSLALPASF